jgi:hypothetical protein
MSQSLEMKIASHRLAGRILSKNSDDIQQNIIGSDAGSMHKGANHWKSKLQMIDLRG